MMIEHAVLLVGGLKHAPRPSIFAILDFHEMDVPLIGCELTSVPVPGQRLAGWCCCREPTIPPTPCPNSECSAMPVGIWGVSCFSRHFCY